MSDISKGDNQERARIALYRLQKIYHPFIKQLADMPDQAHLPPKNALLELLGLQKPNTLDRTPEPPGLPPYTTKGIGIIPADPLISKRALFERETPSQGKAGANKPITFDVGPLAGKAVPGLLERGNIDLNHRPIVTNSDGSKSTIFSVTVPLDKKGEVWKGDYNKAPRYALVPSIVNGKFLSSDGKMPLYANQDPKTLTPAQRKIREENLSKLEGNVRRYYENKHEHLGIFSSSGAADRYAGLTHSYSPDGTEKKVYTPSYFNLPKKK